MSAGMAGILMDARATLQSVRRPNVTVGAVAFSIMEGRFSAIALSIAACIRKKSSL